MIQNLLATKEFEEGPQGRQLPGDRRLFLLFTVEFRHELADGYVIQLLHFYRSAVSVFVRRRHIIIELHQVADIVPQCVLGNVALIFKMSYEIIYVLLHCSCPVRKCQVVVCPVILLYPRWPVTYFKSLEKLWRRLDKFDFLSF